MQEEKKGGELRHKPLAIYTNKACHALYESYPKHHQTRAHNPPTAKKYNDYSVNNDGLGLRVNQE